MKIVKLNFFLCLVLGSMILFSGCSSIQKAKSLHQEGKDKKALEMAIEYLDDGEDDNVRIAAVNLIGKIGGKEAGEALMPILDDPLPSVQIEAVRNIGTIKYVPASDKLISLALENKGDLFETAAKSIKNIGIPAVDLLVKKYASTSSETEKQNFKRVILEVGPIVAAGIAKRMKGKSFFENRKNIELLISFKSPEVATWLLKEIDNPELGDMIVEGLTELGSRAINPVLAKLTELIETEDAINTKEKLITVLGNLKASKAVEMLEELTKDSSERIRNAADFALKKIRGF